MANWNVMGLSFGAAFLAGGLMTVATATEPQTDIEAELKALREKVSRLETKADETWLTERRAEEVRGLVREVLSDADARASLAGDGVVAGYNKNFFLASEDGNFLLKIDGQIQFRYIYTDHNDTGDNVDENEGGFQNRRTKLGFSGHMGDPNLQYKIKAGFTRDTGLFELEEAFVKYVFADNLAITVGQFKGGFLREEWVSSSKQLAVERSGVNESFTLDYSKGVMLTYNVTDTIAAYFTIHDGREQDNINWNANTSDFAVAARVEWVVSGDYKQFDDFQAWSGSPIGVLVGGGIDYEATEGGTGTANNMSNFMQWTADVTVEVEPFSFFAAVIGRNVQADAGVAEPNQLGFVVQGGVFLIPDKLDVFARYEWLDFDGRGEVVGPAVPAAFAAGLDDTQSIVTLGSNYYFSKHASKVTFDVMWAPRVRVGESGSGTITTDNNSDELVARLQYQLLF